MPDLSSEQAGEPAGRSPAWAPAPARPLLEEGAIHVWRADLDVPREHLIELLSGEERTRAERFAKREDGLRFSRSRGLLRALLGRYLERDPDTLPLRIGAHGKPELAVEGTTRCCFNISHSANLGLYAFSRSSAVGVDVELALRARDVLALAARVFGAAETRRLAALEPEPREREFLRLWVRHEATLKCSGSGFGGATVEQSDEHGTWIAELDVGRRAAAALAAAKAPAELRCWELGEV
jgi:4'-phosphopantetheinyl transferase